MRAWEERTVLRQSRTYSCHRNLGDTTVVVAEIFLESKTLIKQVEGLDRKDRGEITESSAG
jgi:hypothetical protein